MNIHQRDRRKVFGLSSTAIAIHLSLSMSTQAAPVQLALDDAASGQETPEQSDASVNGFSQSSLFVMDREEIEASGHVSLAALLQELTFAGATATSTQTTTSDGSARVGLRGLGANRTLVLVNGRRWVESGGIDRSRFKGTAADSGLRSATASVDLNSIPLSAVDYVEFIEDGSAAIYGSDAAAGVVNIVLRSSFSGIETNAYYGEADAGDGVQEQYDFTIGTQSDKGYLTVNASYTKTEPVFAGDREISAEPQFRAGLARGSSATPQGRFLFYDANGNFFNGTTTPGSDGFNQPADPDLVPFTDATRYNFAPDNYLVTPQERTSIYVSTAHGISESIDFAATLLYSSRNTEQQRGFTPLFFGPFGDPNLNNVVISEQNFYNPVGSDIFSPSNPGGSTFGFIGRRLVEAGPLRPKQSSETYHFSAGFSGAITFGDNPNHQWYWDASYTYAESETNQSTNGIVNTRRLATALGPSTDSNTCSDANGAPLTDGCVPFDLFGGAGSVSQAQLNYITFDAQDSSLDQLRNYSANLSGDLFDLPAGEVLLVAGYEHRRTSAADQTDALVAGGQSSASPRLNLSGSAKVDEFYSQVSIPLLSDVAFAKLLDLSVTARHSDYDRIGSTTNSSLELRWMPLESLLIRASVSDNFTAPDINQLFLDSSTGFPSLTDPCINLQTADTNVNGVIEAEEASSVGLPGCAGVSANLTESGISRPVARLGNPDLRHEESESTFLNIEYTPRFVPGLRLWASWYDIQVDDAINFVGAQYTVNRCAETGSVLCGQFEREASGRLTNLTDSPVNIDSFDVSGAQLVVDYQTHTPIGNFTLNWSSHYLDQFQRSRPSGNLSAGIPSGDQNFAGQNLGDEGYPRWKSNLNVGLKQGDWEAYYGLRYIADQTEVCAVTGLGVCSDESSGQNQIDSTGYHDLQVSYSVKDWNSRITLGVNNVLDEEPPASTTAAANSFDANLYDPLGRFYYVRVSTEF